MIVAGFINEKLENIVSSKYHSAMELLKFSFDVNIWGKVPEWVMVIVTTVTAYFLYKTLQSQKEVQKTQTRRLFEIESIRFKESIKPVLRYTLSTEKMMLEDKDKRMVTIEVINETERIATNITPNMVRIKEL